MEYKEYKVIQGQYGGTYDTVIRIPDKLKLMTNPEDWGRFIHIGHQHYMGIIKGDEESIMQNIKGLHVYALAIGEYVIITINNIKFIEPYPYLISEDEFNEEFKAISNYYIVKYDKELRIVSMKKILKIHSENDIEILRICGTKDEIEIGSHIHERLDDLFPVDTHDSLRPKVVSGEIADSYWNTFLYLALRDFNVEKMTNCIDVDYAYELFANGDYEGIDDVINMKKAKKI